MVSDIYLLHCPLYPYLFVTDYLKIQSTSDEPRHSGSNPLTRPTNRGSPNPTTSQPSSVPTTATFHPSYQSVYVNGRPSFIRDRGVGTAQSGYDVKDRNGFIGHGVISTTSPLNLKTTGMRLRCSKKQQQQQQQQTNKQTNTPKKNTKNERPTTTKQTNKNNAVHVCIPDYILSFTLKEIPEKVSRRSMRFNN